jgi:hypothetical protein
MDLVVVLILQSCEEQVGKDQHPLAAFSKVSHPSQQLLDQRGGPSLPVLLDTE